MLLRSFLALALNTTVAGGTVQSDEDVVVVTGTRIDFGITALCRALPNAALVSHNAPSPEEISALESSVELPSGAHPLADYNRFYAYNHHMDELTIVGSYALAIGRGGHGCVRSFSDGDTKQLPDVVGGGCSFIQVWWAVKTKKVTLVRCNFPI
jgi:hypothetical protein